METLSHVDTVQAEYVVAVLKLIFERQTVRGSERKALVEMRARKNCRWCSDDIIAVNGEEDLGARIEEWGLDVPRESWEYASISETSM